MTLWGGFKVFSLLLVAFERTSSNDFISVDGDGSGYLNATE